VHCVRPLEDSILSLSRRGGWACTPEQADRVQRWLWAGKQELLDSLPPECVLDVSYYDLLRNPRQVVGYIAEFLGTKPSDAQIDKAVALVQPDKQHVGVGHGT
jgi:hypothetical protein